MAVDKLVDSAQLDTDLTSVANAIRAKGGTSAQLAFPAGFISEIGSISVPTLDTLTATDNGTYTPQSGHAYDEVIVNVPKGITPSGTKQITENGTFDVTQYAAAEVNVQSGGGGVSNFLCSGYYFAETVEDASEWLITEITLPSDLTTDTVFPHSLGKVPTDVFIFKKSIELDSTYRCFGGVGKFSNGEVVYDRKLTLRQAEAQDSSLTNVPPLGMFPMAKYAYYFSFSNSQSIIPTPTSTNIPIRAGTSVDRKLPAGTYLLGLK